MEKRKMAAETTTTVEVDREALAKVVNYLWHDELHHYLECDLPRGHIFRSVRRLNVALGNKWREIEAGRQIQECRYHSKVPG
jgi:hypothetical protein